MKKPVSKIVRPSEKERALARLSKRYRLSAFYAFGSRAKEAAALVRRKSGKLARSDRDVDLAVLPDVQVVLSAREKVEISLELEDGSWSFCPKRIPF